MVGRLAPPAEVESDAALASPRCSTFERNTGAIVRPDWLGRATRQSNPGHRMIHLLAIDALVDNDDRQDLLCKRIISVSTLARPYKAKSCGDARLPLHLKEPRCHDRQA